MNKTPLFDVHFAASAVLQEEEGWLVPARCTSPEKEVAQAEAGAVLFDLAFVDILALQGEELQRWTNGMFTNNTRRLQPGSGNRHGMCEDRGRLQGLLDLYCVAPDRYLAVLDGVTADWFEERYRMFLILDDIEVEQRPDDATLLSLQGPGAAGLLDAAGLPAPPVTRSHVLDAGTGVRVARRDRTGLGGFDLLVPRERVVDLWTRLLDAGAKAAGTDALDALRIRAGLARWPQDGTDKTLIHELRLNEDVCAFDKGCYVGQEVINRVDVRGAINKRLTGVRLKGPVPHGSTVSVGDTQIGTLTSVTPVFGETLAMGVLRKAAWEPGTAVAVDTGSGTVAGEVVDLPLRT